MALSARLVGDQFVLFFPNEEDEPDLDNRVRTLHAAMASLYDVDCSRFSRHLQRRLCDDVEP